MATRKYGGSRPGNPRGLRGGPRPGSGPTVRRIHLDAETAQELRILWLRRKGVTGNSDLQPVDVVTDLIHAAWIELDAQFQADAENAQL